MRGKIRNVDIFQRDSGNGVKRYFWFDGYLAALVHKMWLVFRRRQMINELEKRKHDEAFLCDVGLSRQQVEKTLHQLKHQHVM